MSRHVFRAAKLGQPVEVVLGFDPPLGHFFLTVFEGREMVYSNLTEADPFSCSLSFYRRKLVELGISVPESMFSEVALDEQTRDAVRLVLHRADGTVEGL